MEAEEYRTMAEGIALWMVGRDTGISSKALAACALLQSPEFRNAHLFPDHPYDAPDLQRCMGLIDQVPGVASALPLIARRSAVWAAYVANWAELTMLANMGDYKTTTGRLRELVEKSLSVPA